MRDGVSTGEKDTADLDALAADNRLIRRVRWQLVAWSGITTLLVLVVLGAALYLIAARTLEDRGNQQLMARADAFREHPDPRRLRVRLQLRRQLLGDDRAARRQQRRRPEPGPRRPGLPAAGVPGRVGDRRPLARRASTSGPTQISDVPVRVRTEKVDLEHRPGVHPGHPGPHDRAGDARRDAPAAARRRRGRRPRRDRVRRGVRPAGARPDPRFARPPSASPCAASASSPPTRATSCGRR